MNSAGFPFSKQYEWENRQEIGRGGFATIYRVKNRVNNQFYAIKQLDMAKFDTQYKLQSIRNQIYLMKECKGINLVEMFNFSVGPTFTYIVLQLCEIDLKEIINQRNNLSEVEAINILIDIVKGYRVLLEKNYIHRDIKPENVLLKNKVYKLTDYGFSRKTKFEFQKFREVCGTAIYMAPQLFYGKQYTSKCDIWSLGLVLYQTIFGFSPWTNRCLQTYKSDIVTRQVSFPYNCRIGVNTKDFIQRCLQLEEQNRMSFKQLYEHPLIKDKNPGPPLFHHQFNEKVLRILARMQRSSTKKLINVRQVFHKYQNYKGMDEKTFYHFLIELDPQITTYESQQVFHSSDFSGDGIIDVHQFRSFYIEVDYRPSSDTASKRIEDLAKMAQARKLSIKELFDMIDLNKNRIIEEKQFEGFIRHIAPKLSLREIDQMFRKFDRNNSKTIQFQQFIRQLTRDNQNKQNLQFPNFQRALRNVQCLKMHFVYQKKSPQQILNYDQMRDSKCKGMSLDEFGKKVRSINYVISRDEIVEMFRMIDHDGSQSISLNELYKLMEKQPY